jgi:hypothetical protein
VSSNIIVILAGVFVPVMVFLIPSFDPAKVLSFTHALKRDPTDV